MPNGGESYYPGSTVQVQWIATGTGLHGQVEAIEGTTMTTIASNVAAASGATITVPWSLGSLPQASTYRIRVTVTDDAGATASDTSDGDFAIRPPQAVSYAGQVQPIWNASCTGSQCHDSSQPQAGLELTQAASYTELVGTPSSQCSAVNRVLASDPDQSYLVWKLNGAGNGTCFSGSEMPKGGKLPAAQIQLVRDWIANGAPNN